MKELRNALKRFLMANLTAALILGSIPVSAFAAEEVTTISDDADAQAIESEDAGSDAIESVEEKNEVITSDGEAAEDAETVDLVENDGSGEVTDWTKTDSLPSESGNYILKNDVVMTDSWNTGNEITLDLNGHSITRNCPEDVEWGYVLIVDGEGTLTLINTDSAKNGVITGGFHNSGENDMGGGIHVHGTLIMNDGVEISGNNGNGVLVEPEGSFTMTGGVIADNTDHIAAGVLNHGDFKMSGGEIKNNSGRGVDVETAGEFTMTGGKIAGNRPYEAGAGVLVAGGKFTMTGGEICDNKTSSFCGGVYVVNHGTFNMSGNALITGNECEGGTAGGVFVVSSNAIMNGDAKITNNKAISGGGISVTFGTFTMGGNAEIKNNIATQAGGGITTYHGNVTICENALIADNSGPYGGGVRTQDATLNMNGGTIKGNLAPEGGGGGMCITGSSVFNLTGGVIVGNSCANYWSGGIFYDKDVEFNISGNPVIKDNYKGGEKNESGCYVGTDENRSDAYKGENNKEITVTGPLSDGAEIYMWSRSGVSVAEEGSEYTFTGSDIEKFHSDVTVNGESYAVELDEGKLFMGLPLKYSMVEDIPDQQYAEGPVEPDPRITNGDEVLLKDVQYTLSYENNTGVGTATVTIKGKHYDGTDKSLMRYVGTVVKTFKITKKIFADTDISKSLKYGEKGSVDLSGFYKPGVTVGSISINDESSILKEGTVLSDKVLNFEIKEDFRISGKSATITIPVTGGADYEDCTIVITISVIPDEDYSSLVEEMEMDEADKDVSVSSNTVGNEDGSTKTTITVGDKDVSTVTVDKDGKITEETKIWVSGIAGAYTYTGSAIKPAVNVYDGTRKLIQGTDYSISYKNNKAVGTSAKIIITFKGSYAGTAKQTILFNIAAAKLEDDVTVSPVSVAAGKKVQKPVPVIIIKSSGNKASKNDFDYTYKDEDGKVITGVYEPGTYSVEIIPKANNKSFTGRTDTTITVTDSGHVMSKATVKLAQGKPKTFTYTGAVIDPGAGRYVLTIKDGKKTITLTEGTDYTVEYSNNINPGNALVTFTGLGDYKGTTSTTFKIVKGRTFNDNEEISITFADGKDEAVFAKGGSKPAIVVMDGEMLLKEGKDYTVAYSKNKAVTSGKTAIAKVKGKGMYKGERTLYFSIKKQSIETLSGNIIVKDPVTTKKGYTKPGATITDLDGKKLKAGTDYVLEEAAVYVVDVSLPLTIRGIGNYDGVCVVDCRLIPASMVLSKLKKGNKIPDQIYTGKPITLSDEVLNTLLKSGTDFLKNGEDFEVSYTNNTKKGTAKVTLNGVGKYGGTRTFTFKIKAKKGNYLGALKGGQW